MVLSFLNIGIRLLVEGVRMREQAWIRVSLFLFLLLLVLSATYYVYIRSDTIRHQIIFHHEDGSTILGISHNAKDIISIEYKVLDDLDLSLYEPYFDSPKGIIKLEENWDVQITELVNYEFNDGNYKITLVPSGTIKTTEGERVPLPRAISFSVKISDNRAIDFSWE
jgi:hypothetical protein